MQAGAAIFFRWNGPSQNDALSLAFIVWYQLCFMPKSVNVSCSGKSLTTEERTHSSTGERAASRSTACRTAGVDVPCLKSNRANVAAAVLLPCKPFWNPLPKRRISVLILRHTQWRDRPRLAAIWVWLNPFAHSVIMAVSVGECELIAAERAFIARCPSVPSA